VQNSAMLSVTAATLIMLATSVVCWIVVKTKIRGRWLLDALVSLPLVFPGIVLGLSIMICYLTIGGPIYGSIWILLIAYVTLYMPYGMRFATSGITQIHKELEEAAAVSGAGIVQMFIRVLLPLLAPIMIASWIYVFVLAVRELSASVFLVGPGTHVLGTISLTMWEEGGSYGAVCALGVIQITPLIVIVAALRVFERRISARFRGEGSQSEVA